jgi:ribosomal protein S18 acetylase RimI-like enzyme
VSNGAVSLREAEAGDLDAVVVLWAEMIDYHRSIDDRLWERADDGGAEYRALLERNLESEDAFVAVGEFGGRVVGYTHAMRTLHPIGTKPRPLGALLELAVARAYRRKGLGAQLAEMALDWMKGAGLTEFTVSVAARNEGATRFWQRLGYEPMLSFMLKLDE